MCNSAQQTSSADASGFAGVELPQDFPDNLHMDDVGILFPEEPLPRLSLESPSVRTTALAGGEEVEIDLDPTVWGVEPRQDIIHRVVRWQLRNARRDYYKTKTISEVSGSGRKLWRQKGTGRARVGHSRPPHWRGGAKAHGPRIRDWSIDLPKKVRALGLRVALSAKYADRRLHVVDALTCEDGRTKSAMDSLGGAGLLDSSCLCVDTGDCDPLFALSVRNLTGVKPLPVRGINVLDLVKHDKLVITRAAVEEITARLTQA
jgi:large subunit ribosomal protein L4